MIDPENSTLDEIEDEIAKIQVLITKKRIEQIDKKEIPRPLLKWVGGKGQIIDKILKKIPLKMNNYHELFIGGGSVLLMILWAQKNNYIHIENKIHAYDLNEALISTYKQIQTNKEGLYEEINKIIDEFSKCDETGNVDRKPETIESAKTSKESYYYWIRKLYNAEKDKTSILSSAYFIFMNKTGFRGMYREGPNGFNIPYGNYKKPKIIDKEELDYISELIQDVEFHHSDFSESFKNIEGVNNFIYLDPPYAPENDTSFVGYTKDGFDINQHKKLFENLKKASEKNMIMMSNANVPLMREHIPVETFTYEVINCRRSINSKDPSAKTEEVIITNY